MSIEASFRTFVLADPAVQAVVIARLFPGELPEGVTLPAMHYTRTASDPRPTHGTRGSSLEMTRIRLTIVADTAEQARSIAALVTSAIHGRKWASDGARILSCLKKNQMDVDREQTPRVYGVAQEYAMLHCEVAT